jgi:large subunit ribosomal protein L29
MNIKEIREKSKSELNDALLNFLKEGFELRMQNNSSQLADNSKLNKNKKTIARIKTVMRENQSEK